MSEDRITLEVYEGVEGPALYVTHSSGRGYRIAGPKPWGGTGKRLASWRVKPEAFLQDVQVGLHTIRGVEERQP